MTIHDVQAASATVAGNVLKASDVETESAIRQRRSGTLSELSTAFLSARCQSYLTELGVHVEQSSDFDLVLETIAQTEKPYLTDFLSPRKNDFFEGNCFWLVLRDDEGVASGVVGARMDDTGPEPLSSYSARKLRNIFPDEDDVQVCPDRLPRIADQIKGRVVYTGDLFLGGKLRSTNRQTLRTIFLLLYCVMHMKWRGFDWLYAFLRDRDVRRGAPWLYHFPRVYPLAHSWTLRPSVKTGEHWLAAMDRLEFADTLSTYLVAPDRL